VTNHDGPFAFCTERRLVALTALTAANLDQLLRNLHDVPGSSIFYHTHHMYLAHHFETPVFSNDFALWAAEALQEEALGEKLAAIQAHFAASAAAPCRRGVWHSKQSRLTEA